jgi:predicted pyridoxine 5'-phosphate oxidase superfamily flavin-nucleotide-binding protein
MRNIPEKLQDLLSDDKKAFAYLGTSMADGTPQVTPVWFNADGEYILINSAAGRVKDKNMRARPRVALCISDPPHPTVVDWEAPYAARLIASRRATPHYR